MNLNKISHRVVMELGNALRNNNYSQEAAEKCLQYKFGSWLTAFAPALFFPLFALELSPTKPLDALLLLFYCCYPTNVEHVRAVLGTRLLDDVCESGLLKIYENTVESTIQVIPFYDLIIATERPKKDERGIQYLSFDHEAVMTLFPDTYDLAKHVKPKETESALDLFCGNGVQSLSLARNVERILGVDTNSKALEFAKFNVWLNDFSNVEFEYCDVNKPIAHLGRFDMIIANPPFCPAINQKTLFCDGGQYGDYFIKLLFNQRLAEVIKDGAKAYIVSPLVLKKGETVESKLKSFRPNNLDYKLTIVHLEKNVSNSNPLYNFLVYFVASRHIGDLAHYANELKEYFNHFRKLNVNNMTYDILELTDIYRQGE